MSSIPLQTFTGESESLPPAVAAVRAERAQWMLNSPDPPTFFQELVGTIRQSVRPTKKNSSKICNGGGNGSGWWSSRPGSCLKGLFPILSWGRNYKAAMFKNDVMAGLTLASLCIPQSIGYANLAKLDPQYGLYTSVVPPLIYAVMGSSREIAIGPVAVVSLLLSSMISTLHDPTADPIAYRDFVFTVTFFAGAFQAVFGLFRLGFLVDFLSHAAIVGFMAGAAIIIGLQQLKGLLGIPHFTTKTDVVSVLGSVFKSLHHTWYPLNLVLGSSFLVFLLGARFIGRRNKKLFWLPAIAPLVSVILSTFIVYMVKGDKHGINIVKHIKSGINPTSANRLQLTGPQVGQAAKIGLISAIVALTEAIAVGRSFATINGYHIDGNKEMVAIGFMNIAGSLTSCYVATGSFSRTAVNYSAGCKTVVSNIVMAVTVMLSLVLFTKLLYYTPMAILASIILSALPGLIDIAAALHIWRVDKLDFLACIGAFFGVLFGSVEIGLLAAVAISFGKVILLSIRPATERLGRLPRSDTFCDVSQYPMAVQTPGMVSIRINSGLMCFANANFIRERILRQVSEEEDEKGNGRCKIQVVILDLSNVMNIDTSGIVALEELHKNLATSGIEMGIANIKWHVMEKMKVAKLIDKVGKERFFVTIGEAIDAFLDLKLSPHNTC